MEDVKIGEYVRIDKDFIVKIDSHATISVIQANPQIFGNTIKHSKNIIDLIEIGDYVNGLLVESVHVQDNEIYVDKCTEGCGCKVLKKEDIKTILTKEQYGQNCYKVGD